MVEHRDRVVMKQELLDVAWTGVAVTENALTRTIAHIRKVLGDDQKAPRFIETVPTRGYRFIGLLSTGVEKPEPQRIRRGPPLIASLALIFAVVAAAVAIGVAVVARTHRAATKVWSRTPDGPMLPATRITRAGGLYLYPAFSPDGTSVAYAASRGGAVRLYRAALDGSGEELLATGVNEMQPAWSPDGKLVAFSKPGGGIWVRPAAGGEPRRLTESGSRPVWSPDGTEIAFQSGEQVELSATIHEPMPPSQILAVDLHLGAIRQVTARAIPRGSHMWPGWRPDGKRIVFARCMPDDCAIYTVARDGSDLRMVVETNFRFFAPVFDPQRSEILYLHNRYGRSDLMSVAVGPTGERVGAPRIVRHTPWSMMQHLAVSQTGSRIAWSVVDQTSNLAAIDVTDLENVSPPAAMTDHTSIRMTFPAFSPDGKKLAYVALIGETDSGVWIAEPDGSAARPLTAGRNLNQRLQWTPTGFEVTYAAWVDGPVIRATSLVTDESRIIARLPRDAKQPALSPDRVTIAFDRMIEGRSSVWIAEGESLRRLTPAAMDAGLAVWSPSGRQIAFQVRDSAGRSQIAVVPLLGGEPRFVTKDMEESWPHSWSPDERFIAFAGRRRGIWNVWAASESAPPRQLTPYTDPAIAVKSPAWSPDGKRIVYELAEPESALWISHARK